MTSHCIARTLAGFALVAAVAIASPALAANLSVTGIDSATAQTLFKDAQVNTPVRVLRLIITQPNAQGQQVPSEIIVAKNSQVTSATMSGGNQTISDTFAFNYQTVDYEFSAPEGPPGPTGVVKLKWAPDVNRPTMNVVHPLLFKP
jgi:hypothetical protein